MLQALSHRGPDETGRVATSNAVLGATRLAIRGLEDGSQPLVDSASGLVAVCNGEIDNHRELRAWLAERGRPVQGQTDVAVIPGLYLELGEGFVSRLVGAFAIAVWNPQSGQLILARDRAGERPLFFATRNGQVIFATEIAAVVSQSRLPVKLERAALGTYLQFGIFKSPSTPFTEIQKVAPGEVVVLSADSARRSRYWRWQNAETPKRPPSLEAFDHTFRAAVARQSDVDVDFGVFLSGGVDSSLVAAITRALYPHRSLKAYTLRFEEDSYDEGRFAEMVARQLKLDLVPVWVRPEDIRAELKTLVGRVGEPLADPALLPAAVLARRAARDIRLALVGEGADELFGGYPTYIGVGLAEQFQQLPRWMRRAVRRVVAALPHSEKKVTASFLLKRFMAGSELKGIARHQLWVSNIGPALLARLGTPSAPLAVPGEESADLLDQVQRWDLEASLAEGLLTKADRSSMSSALELRAPFLDQTVMEFAQSLPISERVRGFQTKVFLKRYALGYLPDRIVHRRKRGLSVPIGKWLRGPLYEWAFCSLASGQLEQAGISTEGAMSLLQEHCQRQADHARALWTLLVLSEWLDWVGRQTESSERVSPKQGLLLPTHGHPETMVCAP
jgi:asparagine synthase (glutamine-hydrolysing)